MDISRGTSPSSPIRIHEDDSPWRRPHTTRTSEWPYQNSSQTAMAIPGSARAQAPPEALPPPRYLHNLDANHDDPGWTWGNPQKGGFLKERGRSNVVPSHQPPNWSRKEIEEIPPEQIDFRRRQSSNSTVMSTSSAEKRFDEGYYSLSGPSSGNPQSVNVSLLK